MSDATGAPLPVHVVLGMDPEEFDAAMFAGRQTPGWKGIGVSKEPAWHSHPALGIPGHSHGTVEEARAPHTHHAEMGWCSTPIAVEGSAPDLVPSVDRAWQLAELAYDGGVTVLGWADSMVEAAGPGAINFTVTPAPDRQEDSLLVLAIRVPHPDVMTLAEVISGDTEAAASTSQLGADEAI